MDFLGEFMRGYPDYSAEDLNALGGMAKHLWTFYRLLTEAGFSKEQAYDLTRIQFISLCNIEMSPEIDDEVTEEEDK